MKHISAGKEVALANTLHPYPGWWYISFDAYMKIYQRAANVGDQKRKCLLADRYGLPIRDYWQTVLKICKRSANNLLLADPQHSKEKSYYYRTQ